MYLLYRITDTQPHILFAPIHMQNKELFLMLNLFTLYYYYINEKCQNFIYEKSPTAISKVIIVKV